MKIAALISGGKDSMYATYQAFKNHELVCLISIKSKNSESYMFHIPNIDLVKYQARAMQIPLIFAETQGIKEQELEDLEKAIKIAIKKYQIQGLVSGAIESNYQKERIENICKKLNIKSITPLWHINKEQYWNDLLNNKFEIIISSVSSEGLDKSWLGEKINRNLIKKLKILSKKFNFHLAFEGGEAETLVTNCPLFKKRLEIEKAAIEMESEFSGLYLIKKVKLINKL